GPSGRATADTGSTCRACSPQNGGRTAAGRRRRLSFHCPGRGGMTMGRMAILLDHLVGALLQEQRHLEAKRFGGLEIDHQFKLDWEMDGEVARLDRKST